MSGKHFFIILGLLFAGVGIRSVIKQEAGWGVKVRESEKRFSSDPDTKTVYFTGPIAIIIGIVQICVGVGLLLTAFKMDR